MLATWLHLRARLRKSNLQPVLNTEYFQIHTKSELGVLNVAVKLVINAIDLLRWNFEKNEISSFYKLFKNK
jgi:hypothetical protein